MDSLIYLHDGSFEGLLHAVATAVKSRLEVKGIYPQEGYCPAMFDSLLPVQTDRQQAQRLFQYLQGFKGMAARYAINGFLSEDREVGIHLYWLVRECVARGPQATQLYTHDSIRYLARLSRRVGGEAHRLNGLIRFRILEDGMQYAPLEPDHNVIGYCAHYFVQRLRSQQWILHDVRRNLALYWDRDSLQGVDVDADFTRHVRRHGEIPADRISQQEQYYQGLWKSFHQQTANPDRTNLNLQRQLMPRRYWKYLVEMEG